MEQLVSKGVKEINIVAQDTTDYGLDIYKKRCLAELLKGLVKIKISYGYDYYIPILSILMMN